MSSRLKHAARLNFRLPAEHKTAIEQAAAALGQSVSDFAVATLVRTAQRVIREQDTTVLTNRDRDRFLAALDNASLRPNAALRKAAAQYKRRTR